MLAQLDCHPETGLLFLLSYAFKRSLFIVFTVWARNTSHFGQRVHRKQNKIYLQMYWLNPKCVMCVFKVKEKWDILNLWCSETYHCAQQVNASLGQDMWNLVMVIYSLTVETKGFIFNYIFESSSVMLACICLIFNCREIFMYKHIFRLSGFGGKYILILRENIILCLGINKRKCFSLPAIISHFDDRKHS